MANETYTLELTRSEICDLLLACTEIKWSAIDEMKNDPDCPEYRRDVVLPGTIKKWQSLHDIIDEQLTEQDKKQDWYDERYCG